MSAGIQKNKMIYYHTMSSSLYYALLTLTFVATMLDYALLADYFAVRHLLAPNTIGISPIPFSIFPIYVQTHSVDLRRSLDRQATNSLRTPLSFSWAHRVRPPLIEFSVEGPVASQSVFSVVDLVAGRCSHLLFHRPIDCSAIQIET